MHVLGAQGVGGDERHQGRVDATRQADGDIGEPVLADVVTGAEHERLVDLAHQRQGSTSGGCRVSAGSVSGRGARDLDDREWVLGRAAPGVEQSLAEGRPHLEVADDRLLLELGGAGQHLALGVEDDRGAVEDQLVLAADLVHVDQRAGGVGCPRGEHPLALGQPVGVVRRGVDVHHELGAAGGLGRDGPGGAPGVLADRHADPDATDCRQR